MTTAHDFAGRTQCRPWIPLDQAPNEPKTHGWLRKKSAAPASQPFDGYGELLALNELTVLGMELRE
jgi:hypothetical protein